MTDTQAPERIWYSPSFSKYYGFAYKRNDGSLPEYIRADTLKPYVYIGKDGKPITARELEDERDTLRAQLNEALNQLDSETHTRECRERRIRELHAQLSTAREDALREAAEKLRDCASQCRLYGRSQAVANGYQRSSVFVERLIEPQEGE